MSEGPGFKPSGFFVLRAPLLAFEEFTGWSSTGDSELLREGLRRLAGRAEIKESIFVASPSLDESIAVWLEEPHSKRGKKVERAIVKYFTRMTARPTPFGLFATVSLGRIGDRTELAMGGLGQIRRHTRLDMDYLFSLCEETERIGGVASHLVLRPNGSMYSAGGRLRYAESRIAGESRTHHLVAVESASYLLETLQRASEGASRKALAAALVDDEVGLDEANEYVGELLENQILVSDLAPAVTGEDQVAAVADRLRSCGEEGERIASTLNEVRVRLDKIDTRVIGSPASAYREIASALESHPAKVRPGRLFQVDTARAAPRAVLGKEVLGEITKAVGVLLALSPGPPRALEEFRDRFRGRYEGREVPLVEALDEESGIGYQASEAPSAEASPLLEGLSFPPQGSAEIPWGRREGHLLERLRRAWAEGSFELLLEREDIQSLTPDRPAEIPGAFQVMGSIAAVDEAAIHRGEFTVVVDHASGPSGARMLGRFCHLDEELTAAVRSHLREEESLRPDAIHAEIVHLPEGRVGNILLRPVLREYEIPYLGVSGVPEDRQIPVNDLMVSVQGARIVLRSTRLDREIIPRLTSAHNYTWRSLGIYRFLCSLQHQGVASGAGWSWEPFERAAFLPRVRVGRAVLRRARWRIGPEAIKALGASPEKAVASWREELRLPRHVLFSEGDNELLIDLDNPLSVAVLAHDSSGRESVVLSEMYPPPSMLCATSPAGHHVHEFVIPFVRSSSAAEDQVVSSPRPGPARRRHGPWSEWLYVKIYTGTSTADRVLTDAVGPVARWALEEGVADRWFFIRYGDPDWHLRARFHGDPGDLMRRLWPRLSEVLDPMMEAQMIYRAQLDTYEREVERYGGPEGMEVSEAIFQADSEAALGIVELLSGDEGADARWRLALLGMDLLLSDLRLDDGARASLVRRLRDGYASEFRLDSQAKRKMGERYRTERAAIATLLAAAPEDDHPLEPGIELLKVRSERIEPHVRRLEELKSLGALSVNLDELAESYLHMHANRLLRSAGRAQEAVIYDMLDRIYHSSAARSRGTQSPISHP